MEVYGRRGLRLGLLRHRLWLQAVAALAEVICGPDRIVSEPLVEATLEHNLTLALESCVALNACARIVILHNLWIV